MDLKSKVERLEALLNEHPKIMTDAKLTPPAAKLEKEIDGFLAKSEAEIYKNSAEYAELASLFNQKQLKDFFTVKWFNDNALNGDKFTKLGKKEKEEFAIKAVKAGRAGELINQIKDTPRHQMEKELNAMVLAGDAEVAAKIKAMKPPELERFCTLNEIPIVKKSTGALDKNKTQPNILIKIQELREYTKLIKV
jgi:hypothetical protein